MPRRRLEDTLAELRRLKAAPLDDEARRELHRVLSRDVCFAVVRAAEAVAHHAAAELLARGGDVAEAAALALGASRLPGALPILWEWMDSQPGPERTALMATASRRREEGMAPVSPHVGSAPAGQTLG